MQAPLDVFLTETSVCQPDIFFVSKKNLHLLEEHGIHGAPDNLRKSETDPEAAWLEGDFFDCKLFPGLRLEAAKFFVR